MNLSHRSLHPFAAMKSLAYACFVLAAAACTSASSDSENIRMPFNGNDHAYVGMTSAELVRHLGEPSEKLSDFVWAYWDFRPVGRPASQAGDALVVLFTKQRVSLLRVTTRAAVEAALQNLRKNATPSAVAAPSHAF